MSSQLRRNRPFIATYGYSIVLPQSIISDRDSWCHISQIKELGILWKSSCVIRTNVLQSSCLSFKKTKNIGMRLAEKLGVFILSNFAVRKTCQNLTNSLFYNCSFCRTSLNLEEALTFPTKLRFSFLIVKNGTSDFTPTSHNSILICTPYIHFPKVEDCSIVS